MSLSINTNPLSLNAQRNFDAHVKDQAKLISRLTTGVRIGGAADDPAGQAIAARMASGQRGISQAIRSINDATSMLQVADSAMASVTDSLQRLRELAVAAGNGSYSDGDKAALQKEAVQLLNHITQVGTDTKFNGEAVFAQDKTSIGGDERKRVVIDGLKSGWLSSAEDMVKQYYGLQADGAKMIVNLDTTDGASNVLASVSGAYSGGKFTNIHLNIDMADFGTATTPDGGGAPFYSDRVVAHEMAHAIMSRTMNFQSLPQWFIEGTAELIQGADERLAGAVGGGSGALVAAISGGTFSYEGAYAASRYLHDRMKDLGVEGGIKGVMQHLTTHQSDNLDQALNAVSGGVYATAAAFMADFGANGENFIDTKMNLANADTGAIGGLDADGGASRDGRAVVADTGTNNASDGLAGFDVEYPELGGATGVRRVQVQAGDGAGDLIDIEFSAMNAAALGLADLDMDRSSVALLHIDQALEFVNQRRVVAGASSNRLDLAANALHTNSQNLSAARERIEGVDYATSTAGLTRSQILQQAASAMLAQANSQPRAVLSLLR
ncbi:flagellinolysin [Massilia sp. ST3]|uniref:flagellinolysin n=1 Tax=Massilia sp. ST3 TaxID=2824903 RepID=UPI001B8428CF|nr:flagellinolysin [Massilia sp. ST3]MBQ5950433.1 flagellinolysin [Massilia sp. ST3]